MKRFFTLFFIASAISTSAQISIVRADYGSVGDVVKLAIDSPVSASLNPNILLSGPNRIWNFTSGVNTDYADSMVYTAPGTGAPASANLLVRSSNNSHYEFVDANYVKMILDRPNNNISGLSLKVLRFSINYGSLLIDTLNYSRTGTPADFNAPLLATIGYDSVRAEIWAYDSTYCEGWGVINLPDTSCNVLKVKVTVVSNTNLYGYSAISGWTSINTIAGIIPHQRNVEYQWIGKKSKSFIARAAMDSTGTMVQSFRFQHKRIIPSIKTISPSAGQRGQTLNVTIAGNNTHFFQVNAAAVNFNLGAGKLTVNTVNASSDTTMLVNITITQLNATGLYDLVINDPISGMVTLAAAFQVNPSFSLPQLISLSPVTAGKGKTLTLTISGSETHFKQNSNYTRVSFYYSGIISDNIKVNSTNIIDDSTLSCSISIDTAAILGLYTLVVSDFVDGTLNLIEALRVTVPTGILSIPGNEVVFNVYPNPANEVLHVFVSNLSSDATIQLFDQTGKWLRTAIAHKGECLMDIRELKCGIYLCKVAGDSFTATRKVIIGPK